MVRSSKVQSSTSSSSRGAVGAPRMGSPCAGGTAGGIASITRSCFGAKRTSSSRCELSILDSAPATCTAASSSSAHSPRPPRLMRASTRSTWTRLTRTFRLRASGPQTPSIPALSLPLRLVFSMNVRQRSSYCGSAPSSASSSKCVRMSTAGVRSLGRSIDLVIVTSSAAGFERRSEWPRRSDSTRTPRSPPPRSPPPRSPPLRSPPRRTPPSSSPPAAPAARRSASSPAQDRASRLVLTVTRSHSSGRGPSPGIGTKSSLLDIRSSLSRTVRLSSKSLCSVRVLRAWQGTRSVGARTKVLTLIGRYRLD